MQNITASQASPEVPINENFASIGYAEVYARNPITTTGLTWGYWGGRWGGTPVTAGTIALTASATNYLVVSRSLGTLSTSTTTTNWADTTNYLRVYAVTTGVSTITSFEDHRAGTNGIHGQGPSVGGGGGGRETLTAARTYYVATTGNDTNTGLSAGVPFLTIQKAIDVVANLDMREFAVTIQVADGTYTAGAILRPCLGTVTPTLLGNATTPANVLISTTSANCISIGSQNLWNVTGFKFQTTTGGSACNVSGAATLILSNVDFGQCVGSHMFLSGNGTLGFGTNYSVSGGSSAGSHAYAITGGRISSAGRTVTITNTPNFATSWLNSDRSGQFEVFSMTFSGAVNAAVKKYQVNNNATCFASAGVMPGGVAGTVSNGGIYF